MNKDRKVKIGKRIIEFDDIRQATEPEPEPPEELKGEILNGAAIIQQDENKTEE